MGNAPSSSSSPPPVSATYVGILFCSSKPRGTTAPRYSDDMGTGALRETCVFQGTTFPPTRNLALTTPGVLTYHVFYRDTRSTPYVYWGAARRVSWTFTPLLASGQPLPTVTLARAPSADALPAGQRVPLPFPQSVMDFYASHPTLRNRGIFATAVFEALLTSLLGRPASRAELPDIHLDGPHTRGIYLFDIPARQLLQGTAYKFLPNEDAVEEPLVPDDDTSESDVEVTVL